MVLAYSVSLSGLAVPVKQVRQVPARAHLQLLGYPRRRHGGLCVQLRRQPYLERLPFSSGLQIFDRPSLLAQRCFDQPPRPFLRQFHQFLAVMARAPLPANLLQQFASKILPAQTPAAPHGLELRVLNRAGII